MELRPCDCGVVTFEQRHWLEERGDDLIAIYEGPCRGCRKVRRFEMKLIDDIPPAPPAFGGPTPSQLIDPGEFFAAAERAAEQVPEDIAARPLHERAVARRQLALAVAALDEVLKFIPDGEDRVPVSAFDGARSTYDAEPARFDRGRIEGMILVYRRRLTRL